MSENLIQSFSIPKQSSGIKVVIQGVISSDEIFGQHVTICNATFNMPFQGFLEIFFKFFK